MRRNGCGKIKPATGYQEQGFRARIGYSYLEFKMLKCMKIGAIIFCR